MHEVHITTDGVLAKVIIDGKEVPGVCGYRIVHDVGGLPILQLDVKGRMTFDAGHRLVPIPEPWSQFKREGNS